MQVEHKTEKGTITFDLIPKDAFDIRIRFNKFLTYRMPGLSHIELFDKGVIPVGLTSEVTEDGAKMMVNESVHTGLFMHHNGLDNVYCYKSAVDSFKSLMHHLQVYEVNPIEKPNIMHYHPHDSSYYKIEKQKFQQAELHTGKWVVLFKPNEL